jgi:hypothetical protein
MARRRSKDAHRPVTVVRKRPVEVDEGLARVVRKPETPSVLAPGPPIGPGAQPARAESSEPTQSERICLVHALNCLRITADRWRKCRDRVRPAVLAAYLSQLDEREQDAIRMVVQSRYPNDPSAWPFSEARPRRSTRKGE